MVRINASYIASESPRVFEASAARRALARLPERAAFAAVEYVYNAISINPAWAGHPLRFELEGLHSARRGDHRIVYEIDPDALEVRVLTIEHRADVYRQR